MTPLCTRRVVFAALLVQLCTSFEAYSQDRPVDEAWHQHFEQARAAFIEQRYAEAAAQLQELAHSARNTTDAKIADELAAIAAASSVLGPSAAPSVTRVRALDFGGLVGTLLAGGATALATDQLGSRTTFGVAAVGGAAGLVLAWLATTGMTPDTTQP
ncbi:MAG: hypothetical protein RL701_4973, partial [Pseudomonadota bacterium]